MKVSYPLAMGTTFRLKSSTIPFKNANFFSITGAELFSYKYRENNKESSFLFIKKSGKVRSKATSL